jgi:ABC-type transport system involved in cytochrome c biogenesis permease subunit
MTFLIVLTIVFYILSTAGYLVYLFIQRDRLYKIGYSLLAAGFFWHTLLIGYAFFQSGSIPVHNLHQTLSLAGWAVTGFFLFFHLRYPFKLLGMYAAPMATLMMIISSRLPVEPDQVQQSLKSIWVVFSRLHDIHRRGGPGFRLRRRYSLSRSGTCHQKQKTRLLLPAPSFSRVS